MRKPKIKRNKAKATLTVTILYDLDGTSRAAIEGLLEAVVSRAAGEGMLSGLTTAEVEGWAYRVTWSKP